MNEGSKTFNIQQLEHALQQVDREVRQWHRVLEDYPGTEYACIAQIQLEKLTTLRATMHQDQKQE